MCLRFPQSNSLLACPQVRQLLSKLNFRPTTASKAHTTPPLPGQSRRLFNNGLRRSAFSTHVPVYTLIGVCCGGYALNFYADQQVGRRDRRLKDIITNHFTCSLDNIRNQRAYTMFTASLMHFNVFHLLVNMAALYSIGPTIIRCFGLRSFLALWTGGSFFCSAFQIAWEAEKEETIAWWQQLKGMKYYSRPLPGPSEHQMTVGASGSLCSMLATICLEFPQARMAIMPIPIAMPAWLVGIVFAGGSIYCSLEQLWPQIGHAGHLGGMSFGVFFLLGRVLSMRMKRFR